jgi:vancomycin resistance protein VanJ
MPKSGEWNRAPIPPFKTRFRGDRGRPVETTATDLTDSIKVASPGRLPAQRAFPVLSSLLCLGLAIAYASRADACAAITVFPAWVWPVPGLGLAALGTRRRPGRRWAGIAALAWVSFLMAFAEEPRSLARLAKSPDREWAAARRRGAAVRVVSLNCAIGNRGAAEEIAAVGPDLVLLQESPGRAEVETIARELFGEGAGVAYGVDASLIARGPIVVADLPPAMRGYAVQARARLREGAEAEVISTRLLPAVFRLDLWSPDCWREQAENRRRRREQLRAIARRIDSVPPSVPVILGGDFNAPQGDAVFRLLGPRLRDAFAEGGRGWGNTILNEAPALRIDQVWVDAGFDALRVVARKTRHSDHRMVVCDLILSDLEGTPAGR